MNKGFGKRVRKCLRPGEGTVGNVHEGDPTFDSLRKKGFTVFSSIEDELVR